MVHYTALFFVNTNNPSSPFVLNMIKCTTSETVLDEWLNYNNYPKVVVITSTDLTQLWKKIQQEELSINEDLNGGE